MAGLHRPDLVFEHVDLFPDIATVLAFFTNLLVARLDFLDNPRRFFKFQR